MAAVNSDAGVPATDDSQLWIEGQVWHRRRKKHPCKVEILLDTGAGGPGYMSLAMWKSVKRLTRRKLDTSTAGFLFAANPGDSGVPPMRIAGSTSVPVLFKGDSVARDVPLKVVDGLPYAFILGKQFLQRNRSALDFALGRGFQPVPGAPWVPFSRAVRPVDPLGALYESRLQFCAFTRDASLAAVAAPPTCQQLPSYHDIAWEDDSSLEWKVRLVDEEVSIDGFTSRAAEAAPVGPRPQARQLVIIEPTARFDLEQGASVGVARSVCWWEPGMPVYCKLVNRSNQPADFVASSPVARMVALNVRDAARFETLFDSQPSVVDPPALPPEPHLKPPVVAVDPTLEPSAKTRARSANMGTLGSLQKGQLVSLIIRFIELGLCPLDPKRVAACKGADLDLPLIDEMCTPFSAKQRRFSPEERRMIRAEVQKLVDRGVIRRSMSPWAAQCLCVKKKDGTVRLCIDWRELNKRLVSDSGGLGDMQSIFDGLKGKRYFTQRDLASGFQQVTVSEKDRFKTAFRDADGMLWEFNRAGFGLSVLPAAFSRRVKSALGHIDGVFSWLDDILIASSTWEEHLATITLVFTRLLAAGLSVNFAKCIFGAASQEFLGMIIDSTGIRPSPSKLQAIAEMSRPQTVEELRTFLGMTGYLRQFVPLYSVTAAPLTNILRHKEFASKRARKCKIPWGEEEDQAFRQLRESLASPLVLAFPDLNSTFELHTDASTIGAGATLMQEIGEVPRVISFASHRWSRTDSRRGPTERECMAILWAVDHFKPYLAGRPFKLVTDCSALTWLFRSRELCPKLHRWALRLMEYDITMVWKSGVEHVLPDTLSRLPHSVEPQENVDDSFPDDATSAAPSDYVGSQGPTLDGVRLADLEPFAPDNDVVMHPADPDVHMISALQALPFASCASLETTGLRRSTRPRVPSKRLRAPGEPPIPLPDLRELAEHRSYTPTEIDSIVATPSVTPSEVINPDDNDDVQQVLDAGGEVASPEAAERVNTTSVPAFQEAVRLLSDSTALAQRQQDDDVLAQVCKDLLTKGNRTGGDDLRCYSTDESGVLWYEQEGRKMPVIPQAMVPDAIALVHLFHGHAGVGSTLHLVRRYFFWPHMARDVRQYVLSCPCRRRKRPVSRRIAMLPGRSFEPWDELQMDILKFDVPSQSGHVYVLLVVDRASKFPFGFPLANKQAINVARKLLDLFLTFGVPLCISCDGGREFTADVVKHVCRWTQADIRFGPSDHPRGQGAVERLGGWLQEMLSELCKSWPDRWDEYVSPALWMKRTLPDVSLPSNMSPFELLFGRRPRTSLDTLVPGAGVTDNTKGLDNFVEQRRQNLLEVRLAMEKRNELRMATRAKANADISRPSAGVTADRGSLVLVRTPASLRHRDRHGMKLQHDLYTGPWTVVEVLERGLSVRVEMKSPAA